MAIGPDDYIYCSPYLNVVSLDNLLAHSTENGNAFDVPDPQPGVELELDRARSYETLHKAVAALPPRQRAVIQLLYFAGQTVTQAGSTLTVSAAAVAKLRTRALNRLFNTLAPRRDTIFI